jgi:hypothetical protein
MKRKASVLALAAIGLIALTGPSSAHALGIASFTAQPGSTQAGANTDFDIAMSFSNQADDVKDLTIGLPPGLVGNPTVAEICPVANLNADTCPAASLVGDVNTNASPLGLLPIDIPGNLYNIPANTGEPARFGIVLRPAGGLLEKVVMQSGAVLRPSDFGLNTVIEDIPNTSGGIPIDINSMTVSLKGQAGDPLGGFIRNPTSCVPAHAFLSVTSYADPDAPVSQDAAPFTPTGCDQVPFSPEFSAKVGAPGLTAENAHPPLTSVIEQSIDEAGLSSAQVLLPSTLTTDLTALADDCPAAQFQAGTCPPSTVIGSAVAASPLLTDPLTGPVIVVANPSGLPRIGLDLTGPMALKLFGDLVISGAGSGVEFGGLPDIPIARFALSFNANDSLINRADLCSGPSVFNTAFDAHSGASLTGAKAAVIEGCTGAGSGKKGGAKGKKCKKAKKKGAKSKKKKKCKRKKRKK